MLNKLGFRFFCYVCLIALMSCSITIISSAKERGLVKNPSFQKGDDREYIENWETKTVDNEEADYSQWEGHESTRRLTHWSRRSFEVETYQLVDNIQPGNYTLSAWVRNGGGQEECYLFIRGYDGAESFKKVDLPLTDQWMEIEISNIEVMTNTATIGFKSKSPAGKWASLDDVYLYKSGEKPDVGLPELYDIFTPLRAEVIESDEVANYPDAKVALVRLSNGKIAMMSQDENGVLQPFYSRALETGFWDTRREGQVTDWDEVLTHFQELEANVIQIMIHWRDWESEEGIYNYEFLDEIVDKAATKGIKTYFVIFTHHQWNMDRVYDDFWAYHLEDRGGKSYSIMWGTGNKYNPQNIRSASREIFLEYWHPEVYGKLIAALKDLASHYKESRNVVAYQIGNEEGFNYYLNNGNDTNPYYDYLFEKWKSDTGKASEADFRKETILSLWKRMATAVHEVDPYKPTLSNLQGAIPEKQGTSFNWNEGVDVNFYKDAMLDMAGPMFHGNQAYKVWEKMDPLYDYTGSVPILFPSEIGARGDEGINMKIYTMNSLERGAQGLGVYCYGELYGTEQSENLKELFTMMKETEEFIYRGLPINSFSESKNIFIETTVEDGKMSNLEKDEKHVLGLFYYPDLLKENQSKMNKSPIVKVNVKEHGMYLVKTYIEGKLIGNQTVEINTSHPFIYNVNMSNYDVGFITVSKVEGTVPRNLALGCEIEADSQENHHRAPDAVDGNSGTRWCAADQEMGHSIKLDLGESVSFSNVNILWEFEHPYQYRIETSQDGIQWSMIVDEQENDEAKKRSQHSVEGSGRYLKLTVTGNVHATRWASLYELEVIE